MKNLNKLFIPTSGFNTLMLASIKKKISHLIPSGLAPGLLIISTISFGLFFSSCDNNEEVVQPDGKYENGVFITNEGVFGHGNGSISFYSNDKDSVYNEIYKAENSVPLGDVVQSIIKSGDKTLIAVNASNKVDIVNTTDFKFINSVSIEQPRYIAVDNNKAYVSSWANGGYVYIINLDSYVVTDSIEVGSGPEGLLITDGKLFVANTGGWGIDTTVTIINLSDNSTTNIDVDANCPSMIKLDKDGKIWVLAKGSVEYDANWTPIGHKPSVLVQIDATTNTIIKSVKLFDDQHPGKLGININSDKLYYGGAYGLKGLYTLDITSTSATTTPLINEFNYGFVINHNDDVIFLLQDAFTSNGKLIRYNADGTKINEFTVGIYPGGGNTKK